MLQYIDFYFYTIEKDEGGVEKNTLVRPALCKDLYAGESQAFLSQFEPSSLEGISEDYCPDLREYGNEF